MATSMYRMFSLRPIILLCLVASGLGQALFAPMAVRCRDASGESRIELGCMKSSAGACLASCDDAEDADHSDSETDRPSGPAKPCQDEPLVEPTAAAKVPPKIVTYDTVAAAVVVAELLYSLEFDESDTQRVLRARCGHDHPPDTIARLRTVIFLV